MLTEAQDKRYSRLSQETLAGLFPSIEMVGPYLKVHVADNPSAPKREVGFITPAGGFLPLDEQA